MKKAAFFSFFIFNLLLLFGQTEDYNLLGWTTEELTTANTAENISYLSEPEKEVILIVNLVRINPRKFDSTFVEQFLKFNEKDSYSNSLRKELRKTSPMSPLAVQKQLTECAQNQASALGKTGKTGHSSPTGQTMDDRFEHYLKGLHYSMYAENIHYADDRTPVQVVLDLLIDTGIEEVGHRKNILDQDARYIGVAIRPHKVYGSCTVQDFGAFFK